MLMTVLRPEHGHRDVEQEGSATITMPILVRSSGCSRNSRPIVADVAAVADARVL